MSRYSGYEIRSKRVGQSIAAAGCDGQSVAKVVCGVSTIDGVCLHVSQSTGISYCRIGCPACTPQQGGAVWGGSSEGVWHVSLSQLVGVRWRHGVKH